MRFERKYSETLSKVLTQNQGMRARSGTMEAVKRSDFDLMLGK